MGNTTGNAASGSSTLLAGGGAAFFSAATNLVFVPPTSGTNIFAPATVVADLSVTVTDAPDPAETNQVVTYTYRAANAGPAAAGSVTVSAPLSPGATFVAADGGVTPASGAVTFAVGTLGAGAQVSRTMSVTYSTPGTVSASASVSGAALDPVASNDTATTTTTINRPPPRYTISGRTSHGGNADLPGVTITLSGGALRTTVTAANGTYAFTDLVGGSSYLVTPSARGFVFDPVSTSFASLAADQRADFRGSPVADITGVVRDASDVGLANVVVSLGGAATRTTNTAADGRYRFTDLPAGEDYTVTPSARGFVFTPASTSFVRLIMDQQADFAGGPVQRRGISGQVRDPGGAGVGGIRITLSGGSARSTTTAPRTAAMRSRICRAWGPTR